MAEASAARSDSAERGPVEERTCKVLSSRPRQAMRLAEKLRAPSEALGRTEGLSWAASAGKGSHTDASSVGHAYGRIEVK